MVLNVQIKDIINIPILARSMRKISCLILIFVATQSIAQVSGKVTDSKTGLPIDFANIWVKNTLRGTTTNANGKFDFENGEVGDTLLISYLGYEELQFSAEKENVVKLVPSLIELDEVVIMPMQNEQIKVINSYEKYKKIKEFYFNGHYSLARFYQYKNEYSQNPFIKKLSVVVNSSLKNKVKFRVHLIKADKDGKPSNNILSEYYILETEKGLNEITVDTTDEKLMFPKVGIFVVVDRLNLKENKYSNKMASDILQPAIGMEKEGEKENTWLGYSGIWITPIELQKFAGTNKNIATNIELTN